MYQRFVACRSTEQRPEWRGNASDDLRDESALLMTMFIYQQTGPAGFAKIFRENFALILIVLQCHVMHPTSFGQATPVPGHGYLIIFGQDISNNTLDI